MSFMQSVAGISQDLMSQGAGPLEQSPATAMREMKKALAGMQTNPSDAARAAEGTGGAQAPSFEEMLGNLVTQVDSTRKAGKAAAQDLMVGRTDNIHGTMIALQESGLAFTLMLEVRNKLVESYQELMRMQV